MCKIKKFFAWILVVVLLVGCFSNMKGTVVNATAIETQTVFNASEQYALDNGNPNGVWTYQAYLPNAEEKLTTLPLYNNQWWGSNIVYVQNNADTGYENMLRMVPELSTKGAAVSFTAPYSGEIEITMNDGCVKSHTYNNHRSQFLMLKNGETMEGYPVNLGDGTTAGSNVYTFKPITLNVQKGDTITFAVLRQSDSQSGTSYISPIITYTEMEGTQLAFNASEQYSVDNGNPNGVWTYQAYLPNAEEKLSTLPLYNNQWWGSNIVYVQNNADTGYENMLRMVPELSTKGAAVSFTAPYSGEIEITMNDGCVKSHTYNNHRSQFLMLKNGETMEGYPVNLGDGVTAGSNVYTFKPITLNVQKGDVITFAVLRNTDGQSGTSYISPVIAYTKIVEATAMSFPSDASIAISDITADGFTMTWPEVENNDVECAYTVYVSEKAFTEIPTEGGQTVTGTSYAWTGLTYGKSYHAAVVASDETTVAWLATTEATTVIPDEYIFNASEQYSLDKGNPNGVWTYQSYLPNETEKLTTLPHNQDSSWWGSNIVYVQNNADGYENMLRMVPELSTKGVAVSFTAPHSGTIEIAMNDGCVKSHSYNNHRSKFLMLKNGEAMEGYPVNLGDGVTVGSNVYTFKPITLYVQQGDVITFAVLRQSDAQSGTSYISPVITYIDTKEQPQSMDPSCVTLSFYNEDSIDYGVSWNTPHSATNPIIQVIKKTSAIPDFTKTTEYEVESVPFEIGKLKHQGVITGLDYDTTYYYRVGDKVLDIWSEAGEFTTREKDVDGFTFLHVTDTHDWNYAIGSAVEELEDVDFVLHTGDFVDDFSSTSVDWAAMLDTSDVYMNLAIQIAAGNHDPAEYAGEYFKIDYEPDSLGRIYYSFDYGDVHFVVLDTGGTGRGEVESINEEQMTWLKQDLSENDTKWTIIGMHKTMYSVGPHGKDADVLAIREQLAPLMDEYEVDLVLSGHDHVYMRTPVMKDRKPDYSTTTITEVYDGTSIEYDVSPDGTVYIIPGASGLKQYARSNWDSSVYYDVTSNIMKPVYAAITIDDDTLTYRLYTVDETTYKSTLYDSYGIIKEEEAQINALKTYNAKDMENVWSYFEYLVESDEYKVLTYDKSTNSYVDSATEATITATSQTTTNTSNVQTVRKFTAPYTGTITVSFEDGKAASSDITDLAYLRVWRGADRTEEVFLQYLDNSTTKLKSFTINVVKGEELHFVVGSLSERNTTITVTPIVSYTTIDSNTGNGVAGGEEAGSGATGNGTAETDGVKSPGTGDGTSMSWILWLALSAGIIVIVVDRSVRRRRDNA